MERKFHIRIFFLAQRLKLDLVKNQKLYFLGTKMVHSHSTSGVRLTTKEEEEGG